jgi:hypothetical protein
MMIFVPPVQQLGEDILTTRFATLAFTLLALFLLYVAGSARARTLRRLVSSNLLIALICAIMLISGMTALSILLATWAPNFGSDREITHMTYQQYVSMVGTDGLDPKGASDIFFRCHSTRDGYDMWLKLDLAPSAYFSLLTQMSSDVQDLKFVSKNGNVTVPIRKVSSNDPTFPSAWPRPEVTSPLWFDPPDIRGPLECTWWDIQLTNRSKGWVWIYDNRFGRLWIWEWNRQYFHVRP